MEQRTNFKICLRRGKTATETHNKCLKCLLYGWKDSEKDMSPWRWSKEWVVISCTECRSSYVSLWTIGQRALNDPKTDLHINQEKICQVLHENMGNRKSCRKLFAHSVKDEPKEQRVTAWDNFTETCQNNTHFLTCIITGNEWVPDISVVVKQNVRWWSDWWNYQWAPTNYTHKVWGLKVCWSLL